MLNTRALLLSGAAAGLIFVAVSTVEIFARPGFDIRKHAISMLSLGDRGWVMAGTFIVAGLLTMACAMGLRQALPGGWGAVAAPLLVGLYGVGLVMAGVFPAPVGMGFPPGTPDDLAPVMTTSAKLHSVAFMVAFSSMILASFVLAWTMGAGLLWALGLTVAGLAMPALIAIGMAQVVPPGIAFYWAAVIAWVALAAPAWRLA